MLLRESELTLFGTAGFYVFAVWGGVHKGFHVVLLSNKKNLVNYMDSRFVVSSGAVFLGSF